MKMIGYWKVSTNSKLVCSFSIFLLTVITVIIALLGYKYSGRHGFNPFPPSHGWYWAIWWNFFAKIVSAFDSLTIFAKSSIRGLHKIFGAFAKWCKKCLGFNICLKRNSFCGYGKECVKSTNKTMKMEMENSPFRFLRLITCILSLLLRAVNAASQHF